MGQRKNTQEVKFKSKKVYNDIECKQAKFPSYKTKTGRLDQKAKPNSVLLIRDTCTT